jgi:L-aminopeptidase/D-esterase-like protein
MNPQRSTLHHSGSITDVPGIEVGSAQNDQALTGCTVVIARRGAVAGVDVRGGAPGTRETDLLEPVNLIQKVHAILLAGGSAFGLDAAGGVMRYLEEQKMGFDTGIARVPIVPAAILFDLSVGDKSIRPNADMGYQACLAASRAAPAEGNFGAGAGASVGKLFGSALAMKSGLGSASVRVGGVVVGALVAVNAFGDVIRPEDGAIVAGLRSGKAGPVRVGGKARFADTLETMKGQLGRSILGLSTGSNTVIGVVATNAKLSKAEATKVAQMAHDGLARTIRPAHTMLDGDTIFALSTGRRIANVTLVGSCAAQALADAILRAVKLAKGAGGLPGVGDSAPGSERME